MWILALIPFTLQALCIVVDEFFFHIKRGLPKWERIGHPVDTLSVLICFGTVLFVPFSPFNLKIYIAFACFSAILVTKDEFIHKEVCPWTEQWLHAVLFSLHPIQLACAGFLWPMIREAHVFPWIQQWLGSHIEIFRVFLITQFCAMSLFLIWQVVYWNLIYQEKIDEHQ